MREILRDRIMREVLHNERISDYFDLLGGLMLAVPPIITVMLAIVRQDFIGALISTARWGVPSWIFSIFPFGFAALIRAINANKEAIERLSETLDSQKQTQED